MKLTCNGNDLSAAVGQVYKAVSTKTLNPLLEGILITAENGALTMLATDLEIAIERVIPADVKIEGKTVVPGRFFAEFVKKLTNERIELSLADSKLKIRYTDSQGFLQCMSADEYPSVKELTDAQKFTIVRSELKDLIQKIAFAVSLDDTRPLLKGVLLEVEDATLTGVALDGYRLAKCVKQIEKTTALMRVVVPARSIAEIARILDDSQDFVEVSVQKNHLSIHLNHTKITTQLLDGDYLNYKQILPTNFDTLVTIPKELFEAGVERAMLLAKQEKSNLVKFEIKSDVLKLESNSEIGNLSEKIPVKLTGPEITIAFNARYFIELLRFTQADHIDIKFTNATSPCVVVPHSGTEDFLYLVLPVRIL